MTALTLLDKLWQRHLVSDLPGDMSLLYIDRHLVYQVTSPQAFEGLRRSARKPWRADTVLATADHNVLTTERTEVIRTGIADPLSRAQVDQLGRNCLKNGLLPVVLDASVKDSEFNAVRTMHKDRMQVDLATQTFATARGGVFHFEIDPDRKHCLLEGLDDIALTLQATQQIHAY